MTRYNSNHKQFTQAKSLANQAYLTKMVEPVKGLLEWGYGYNALASALNAKGYLTQRGNFFTRESVRTLLKNLGLATVGAEE
ncbi:recombinase family protein [Aeromonas rivipollensis]|uniref:recombinase family protein n=1 Tax=Aeromonas rivipollensis TaxID=948519 RepID=UPI0038CFDA06